MKDLSAQTADSVVPSPWDFWLVDFYQKRYPAHAGWLCSQLVKKGYENPETRVRRYRDYLKAAA